MRSSRQSDEEIPMSSQSDGIDAPYPTKTPVLTIISYLLVIILTGTTIGLAVRLAKVNRENSTSSCPETASVTPSTGTDFPLVYPLPTWNITTPQHNRLLQYEVTQGTWMNVDISPDGTELVFDVLGDLYTLDVNTGRTDVLRAGVATEWGARYSPDGQYILFTSDVGGCDNLWVLKRSSGESWAITDEAYRLVTDGSWSINGSVIIGTKWYTVNTRSIPGGEIWSYPFSANQRLAVKDGGRRLIGRSNPDSQAGPQEGVLSPDGLYLYYCQNTMDSVTWNYDKNPHQGIYTIFRLNLQSNAVESITGGTGGAARPLLSNNGLKLAFIRRYYFQTSLVLRDLQTGNEEYIFDGLTHDQQACSSPHGNYPKYAFSGDDQSIIIWAQGGLLNISLSSGVATSIPFKAEISLLLAPTVRPEQILSEQDFKVQIANWPSFSTIGGEGKIIYNAIGRAWVKSVNNIGANPTPLTDLWNDSFQFYPTFAQNTNDLTYALVSWNDTRLGSLLVYREGSFLDIAGEIGRYAEPYFCPSQATLLAYRRLGGDTLSGSTYATRSGIYLTSESEDRKWDTTLLTRNGVRAHFSWDCQQVFVARGGFPNVTLTRISIGANRAGRTELLIASSVYATDIIVSSDAKWVAFIEFNEVYVTPLTNELPLTLTARPNTTLKTLYRLSDYGSHWIDWDQGKDKHILRFVHGAKYYEVDIDDVSRQCNNGDLNCVRTIRKMYDLSFQTPADIASQTYVCFDNATVLTMTDRDDSALPGPGRVIVRGNFIEAVGLADQLPCDGIEIIDLEGGIIMPGLIDAHAHWSMTNTHFVQQSWEFVASLAFGVTTMHNPSANTVAIFSDRELVLSGNKLGPRLFSTGTILYGAGGSSHCEINTVEDAQNALLNLKEYGAWSAKSYQYPCRSSRQQLLEAARLVNMSVVVEGGMAWYWNLNHIVDGHTTLEHSLPIVPIYEDVIEMLVASGTGWTPTHVVNFGDLAGEHYWYQHFNIWENERLMRFASHKTVRSRSVRRSMADDRDYYHFQAAQAAATIANRGGFVQAGAHGQMQGIAIHWEMGMLQQGGLTPHQVLYAATASAAHALGLSGDIGTLEQGKLADLIVFDSAQSPLFNLTNTQNVKYVMKSGYLWNASTMEQILPFSKPLPTGPAINDPHKG